MSGWAEAEPRVFWLDGLDAPAPTPLEGAHGTDLAVVGGGFTGLWAALQAKQDDPARDVVLLEADRVGGAASGRNGGFVDASLTHGIGNGLQHFPDEVERLQQLGRESFAAIRRHAGDAHWEETGTLWVATRPHEVPWVVEEVDSLRAAGEDAELLDRDALRAEIDSPTYLAGSLQRSGCALVDPGRLAQSLRLQAVDAGVRIHEGTRATDLRREGAGVAIETRASGAPGELRAERAILATSAFPPLVRAIRRYVVPVWDYVLVTEPLSAQQRAAVGWGARHGVSDAGNRFHYYRLTADDRILWGGFDAIYHYGNGIAPELAQRATSFELLERHFRATFPQLEELGFTHRWGGAIDTCTRFCAMFGRALGGRAAYAVGYTGLGVAASRFGARVALDLVSGRPTELTRLRMVRRRPLPFPPEPLRWASIELTQRALAHADENAGRRGPWLRLLDRVGAGFDS